MPTIQRFAENPIIRPPMLPGNDGNNINGPSLIRVPQWVPNPLGRYYLYFAHHGGKYIRMAYADDLHGPWTLYSPIPGLGAGVLALSDCPACRHHIASPDLHIDRETRQIRMYFHGPSAQLPEQKSFVAFSPDGIHFTPSPTILGPFYFRCFQYHGYWYAISKGGELSRSPDGLQPFELSHNPFTESLPGNGSYNVEGSVRHVALDLRGDDLAVYFTRIGDAPESIFRATLDLRGHWHSWRSDNQQEILRPQTQDEGIDAPVNPSFAGPSHGREHALRDPALFFEDGQTYLLYSVAGELGVSIARITT